MTAVEWLVEQICVDVPMYNDDGNETNVEYWCAYRSSFDLSNFINKAKEMEKYQIENAFYKGIQEQTARALINSLNTSPEEYYNKTFKNK